METEKLSALPEEDSEEHANLGSDPPLPPSQSAFSSVPDRPASLSSQEKYSPLDWSGYFDREDDVAIPDTNDVFHIYMAGSQGPVVFCLHGGGYSGLLLEP